MNPLVSLDKQTEELIGTSMPAATSKFKKAAIFSLFVAFLLAGIYLSSFYNYLLFHCLAEGFSIVIACGVFMVAWNTRRLTGHSFLLFIGVAYLFIGMLDFVHTLSYDGMNIIKGYGPNAPTQLWITSRYVESLTLLTAPFMLRKRINPLTCLMVYSVLTALALLSIFVWRIFPDCFLPGTGLTSFKIVSEYIICAILVTAGICFLQHRTYFEKGFLVLSLAAIAMTILAELSFTTYASVFGFSNLLGHLFKIISFYLIYKAVIETGLTRPYDLLFRDLYRQRERLRVTLASIGDAVITTDGKGRVTFLNSVAEALTGWPDAEAKGKPLEEIFHIINRDSREIVDNPVHKVLATNKIVSLANHTLLIRRDGMEIPIDDSAAPILDYYAQIQGVVLIFRDITEREQAEVEREQLIKKLDEEKEALSESEQRYRIMGEILPYGVWLTDAEGKAVYTSQSFLDLLEMSMEEMQGFGWTDKLVPEDVEPMMEKWMHCVKTGQDWESEHRIIGPNGDIRTVLTCGKPIRDNSGIITAWAGINLDITKRKEAEAALEASEEKFSKAFHVSPTFLFISELSTGTFIEVNDACCLLSGWSRDELIGHTSLERNLFSAADREKIVGLLQTAGRVEMMEIDISTRTGKIKTCLFSAEIIKYIGKKCIVCSGVDLTVRKNAEQKLEAVNKELEAFSYSVSHDLRAPLRYISGFSSLLRKHSQQLDGKADEYLQRIEAGAAKMDHLINDLLRLSRINRQEMVIEIIDLSCMANTVINELALQYPERHVEIQVANDLKAKGDAPLTKIALANLLGNAWKYTGKTVEARIELGTCKIDGKEVFFVRDNGAGFPMEQVDRLFQPFQRLHSEKEFSGIGIGLPIVHRVINRHGGEIWAEGEVGKGATFYFTLSS